MIGIRKEEEILELRARGCSYLTIAKTAKVAKQTAVDVCKARREELETLRAYQLEELYQKTGIAVEQRIQAHAELFQRIRKEIASRDLSDIPTDRLIALLQQEEQLLRDIMLVPMFRSSEEASTAIFERVTLKRALDE